MENSHLKRINELAAKAKSVGLTDEELAEREKLRAAYLAEFRASMTNILDHTSVKYPDGSSVPLRKKNS